MNLSDITLIERLRLLKFKFENVIQIVDYFNRPNIDNYPLLEKNINVSPSFGVVNKTKSKYEIFYFYEKFYMF